MVKTESEQRERLAQLVGLARVYRGWNRQELSGALNREASKMVPASGNPKLDLVFALSEALDWSVGEVAEILRPTQLNSTDRRTFQQLDADALAAHRAGDWRTMEYIAALMAQRASSSTERALAANRLSGAFDGQGRYTRSLAAVQAGLAESGVTPNLRLMLQVNLANAHAMLWHLLEARSVSTDLIHRFELDAPATRFERVAQAFAYYIRGTAGRRLIDQDPHSAAAHATSALEDLEVAAERYDALAAQLDDSSYLGVAQTCRGGILECEALLGVCTPQEALDRVMVTLDDAVDPNHLRGDFLESRGWWCVCGGNIALRHLYGPAMARHVAVFTTKCAEIAEQLDNWSLRERTFTHDWLRRVDDDTQADDWVLDDEDVRIIAGTMGRFPHFRETGWKILDQAGVLDAATEGGLS